MPRQPRRSSHVENRLGSAISTRLPADELVIESTELSGTDAFEEIANIDDIAALRDPLRERLLEAVKDSR